MQVERRARGCVARSRSHADFDSQTSFVLRDWPTWHPPQTGSHRPNLLFSSSQTISSQSNNDCYKTISKQTSIFFTFYFAERIFSLLYFCKNTSENNFDFSWLIFNLTIGANLSKIKVLFLILFYFQVGSWKWEVFFFFWFEKIHIRRKHEPWPKSSVEMQPT